jgi:hypothetical protein
MNRDDFPDMSEVYRRRGYRSLRRAVDAAIVGLALGGFLFAFETKCFAWGSLACAQIFFIEIAADIIDSTIVLGLVLGGVTLLLMSRHEKRDRGMEWSGNSETGTHARSR